MSRPRRMRYDLDPSVLGLPGGGQGGSSPRIGLPSRIPQSLGRPPRTPKVHTGLAHGGCGSSAATPASYGACLNSGQERGGGGGLGGRQVSPGDRGQKKPARGGCTGRSRGGWELGWWKVDPGEQEKPLPRGPLSCGAKSTSMAMLSNMSFKMQGCSGPRFNYLGDFAVSEKNERGYICI